MRLGDKREQGCISRFAKTARRRTRDFGANASDVHDTGTIRYALSETVDKISCVTHTPGLSVAYDVDGKIVPRFAMEYVLLRVACPRVQPIKGMQITCLKILI